MSLARRLRWSVGSSLVLAALVAGGCDKGSKGGGGGGKGMAGASAVAPKGGLARALAMMPATSEIVFALDFKQVRSSALWKKFEPRIMGKVGGDLAKFKEICGWDPIEKASGALAGGRGREMTEMTVFVKGFDKASVTDCLKKASDKFKAEADGQGRAVTIDGNYVEMTSADKPPMRFIFADDETILLQRTGADSMADKAALEKVLASKDTDGLMSSATFSSIIDATDTAAAVWFVMNGNSSLMQGARMPFKFKAIFASARAASGVDGVVKLRMDEEKDATGLAAMAQMSMGQIEGTPYAQFAKGVKIDSKGKDVTVSFKFTDAQIETMAEQASALGGL